jgi:hypothetical protein
MANQIDCAIMSGVSYRSTRADINRLDAPNGWTEIQNSHKAPESGFEAISFRSTSNPDEIVIAIAGTAGEGDW